MIRRSNYEKISNFILNTADVDTCNVSYLYDIYNKLDEYINDDELVEVTPESIRLRKRILYMSSNKKHTKKQPLL